MMASGNRAMKALMVIVNISVWGFVILRILPLIFGDSETASSPVPERKAIRPAAADGSSARRVSLPAAADGDSPRGSLLSNAPWMGRDLIPFFASIFDPFRPVVAPARPGSGVRVAPRKRARVTFKKPRGEQIQKKKVVTHYRLSSIIRISGKTMALLTTGHGSGAQTINVKQGMRLPGDDYVKTIDFKAKNVILVKEGHVFKLVDYSPWVILIKKP